MRCYEAMGKQLRPMRMSTAVRNLEEMTGVMVGEQGVMGFGGFYQSLFDGDGRLGNPLLT